MQRLHIGGYGPQLTPLGRAFKIGGYTQTGGEGWQASVSLSAMVLTSFNVFGAFNLVWASTPAAQPILGNGIGYTVYTWYDHSL
jgi:hypothetical protein